MTNDLVLVRKFDFKLSLLSVLFYVFHLFMCVGLIWVVYIVACAAFNSADQTTTISVIIVTSLVFVCVFLMCGVYLIGLLETFPGHYEIIIDNDRFEYISKNIIFQKKRTFLFSEIQDIRFQKIFGLCEFEIETKRKNYKWGAFLSDNDVRCIIQMLKERDLRNIK